ncbi:DNA polymerase III subunit beta [Paenibacillus sp. NPDC057886]|uniref:DNA polymerase III subunit beta n=1 Tax=Paenibacillus sp. NPDC057886 TaxID=3346270 RepID=UPI0036C420C5
MLVHLSRDLLARSIQHVFKALSNNSQGILSGLYIYAGSKEVIFSGSNVSLTVQYRACISDSKIHIFKEGSIVCPAKYLYEIIRKLNDGNVVLEVNEQLILSITSGNTRVCLSGMSPIDYPFTPTPYHQHTGNSIDVSCSSLKSLIKQVAGAVSTSEGKPILTGVSLKVQGNLLTMIATDGVIRMATRSICIENGRGFSGSAVIPGVNLMEIVKLLDDEDDGMVTIQLNHHEIRFIAQNQIIESMLIEGLYPSTRNLIPTTYVSEIILNIKSFRQVIDRVFVLADYHLITMHISEKKLELISSTAEIGEVRDVLLLKDKNGENFSITINGKYLLSTLRCIESDSIRIRYAGTKSPLVLLPALDNSTWLFLLNPVMTRINV